MKHNHQNKSYTVEQATEKLMQYCSYQDRCYLEVEQKLMEMRMIPQARETILIKLIEEDFLNEERFARSYARGKFRIKKWGRIRIKQELRRRRISHPVIRLAMTEIDPHDYHESLYALAEKKREGLRESNPMKIRKSIVDHLLRKGYENHLVYEVVQELTS